MKSSYLPLFFGLIVSSGVTQLKAADAPIPINRPAVVYPAGAYAPAAKFGNVYVGVDANTHEGLAGYVGVLYAPGGESKSGLRFSAFGLLGKYEYHSEPDTIQGRFSSVDLLVGWAHVINNGSFTLSIGANFQDHKLRPDDPENPVRGSAAGFKVQGDFYLNPTPNTMAFGLASYATTFNTYYSILRTGYDVSGKRLFLGPEIGALGNDRTDQVRVGVHASGLRIGPALMTISGGWMHERGEGPGGYVTANLDFAF